MAVFLSIIGTKNYSLLHELLLPTLPLSKSVKSLLGVLNFGAGTSHHFKFYPHIQGREDSVATFVAEMRQHHLQVELDNILIVSHIL